MVHQRVRHFRTQYQHVRAHAAGGTHGFFRVGDVFNRVGVGIAPLGGGGQILVVAAFIGRAVLQQRGGLHLLAQLHADGGAARSFGLLVKHAFRLLAVVHAYRQIVLLQHNRQKARAVQRNHVGRRAHGAFGGVFNKRAFAKLWHLHAFAVGKHHGHNLFADKLGLFVAQGKVGQDGVDLTT